MKKSKSKKEKKYNIRNIEDCIALEGKPSNGGKAFAIKFMRAVFSKMKKEGTF